MKEAFAKRRPSFRLVLLILMILQVTLAVALAGGLAYYYGQNSAQEVATHLRSEYTTRIEDRLRELLQLPRLINQLNRSDVERGDLDPADMTDIEHKFQHQARVFGDSFDFVGWFVFGRQADGASVSFYRFEGDRYRVDRTQFGGGASETWRIRSDGQPAKLVKSTPNFDPRRRPWYRKAVEAQKMAWTDAYVWFAASALCVDSVVPVYDAQQQLLGVLTVGFTLSQVSDYLRKLKIGRSGRTFLIDRQGRLVAASVAEVLSEREGQARRIAAVDSADPLIRATARYLKTALSDGRQPKRRHLEFDYDGDTVYVQVSELDPELGLDWLIVVAVPESDFMQQVEANIQTTILLCMGCIVLAVLLGMLAVRWIAEPLMVLTSKAEHIRKGNLEVQFVAQSRDEIGTLTETMGDMVEGLKEREMIHDAFGRYVSPQLAEEVLRQPDALKPGGTLQTITILMSDLRGFTKLSAALGPAKMVDLLNRYLARMSEVIVEHDGLIDEFIGDAILVLFGAPTTQPDDAERAVRCAIAMQLALLQFNEENRSHRIPPLQMGIGINTGEVILGNIGSAQHVKYGVVGDAVNIAGRIESMTVGTQIMLSQHTYERVQHKVAIAQHLDVNLKGHEGQLTVYEVRGMRDEPELRLPDLDDQELKPVALDAEVFLCIGKTVQPEAIPATIVAKGMRQLEVACATPLDYLQSIKLRIPAEEGGWSEDLYGKVTLVDPPASSAAPANATSGNHRYIVTLT